MLKRVTFALCLPVRLVTPNVLSVALLVLFVSLASFFGFYFNNLILWQPAFIPTDPETSQSAALTSRWSCAPAG